MIKPILTYANDFRGCLILPPHKKNHIEIMQMKVFKQILGVHKQTTNSGVLLEMGRATLDLECIKYGIKNWERIRKGRANAILIDTYNDALKDDLPWITGVKSILEKNNLSFFSRNEFPDRHPFIYKQVRKLSDARRDRNAFELQLSNTLTLCAQEVEKTRLVPIKIFFNHGEGMTMI